VYGKGLDVLGGIVEAIHGSTLESAVDHYVCGPLGLADTGFTLKNPERLAIVYADNLNGAPLRMPDPHFVDARGGGVLFSPGRVFNPKAFQSGGSGGLGSAPDFMRFLEALRKGGDPILSEATMCAATRNQIGDVEREPGSGFGYLGAVVFDLLPLAPPACGYLRVGRRVGPSLVRRPGQ
jgi:CubicO group peptidase (beta-lactamase class C family)